MCWMYHKQTMTLIPNAHLLVANFPGSPVLCSNVHVSSNFRIDEGESILREDEDKHEPEPEPLIPGLSDDIALKCLAKVSHGYHGKLRAVSSRWQSLINSEAYRHAQMQEGKCGDWLFVLTEEPKEGLWTAFDPEAGKWHVLPPIQGVGAHRRHYGFSCVGVSKRLLVIGGYYSPFNPPVHPVKYYATNDVLQFDPFTRRWSQVASMNVPRCSFACAVVRGKVYVAGGCKSSQRSPLTNAEVYDPEEDRWEIISSLPHAREDCVGVALADQFYVIAGVAGDHAEQRIIEVFDPGPGDWSSLPGVWLYSRQMPCPVTALRGSMYVSDDWDANSIKVYDPVHREWACIGTVPSVKVDGVERRAKMFDFRLVGLGQRLYVIGGKALRWQHSQGPWKKFDILRLNNVKCCDPTITARDEEVVWKRVESMGESRGAVLGCAVLEE